MSSSSSSPSHSDDSTNPKRITISVALSIVSGIIILASSLFWLLFMNTTTIDQTRGFMGNTMGNHMMNGDGMMNFHGFMGWMGGMGGEGGTGVTGSGWIFPLLVIISGVMILIGAMIMYKRPQDKKVGGIIVIIFSVLGLTGMGFSIIGSIIGIVGGIVALVEK